MSITEAQAAIAVPILNSYAHDYLGMEVTDILISGGGRVVGPEMQYEWGLIVVTKDGAAQADDLDAAKRLIDVHCLLSVSSASSRRIGETVAKSFKNPLATRIKAPASPTRATDFETLPSDQRLGDAPLEAEHREVLNYLADMLDGILNGPATGADRALGFVLMMFPFGSGDGRCNYISNANRADVLATLKHQVARFEGQPELRGEA